MPLSRQRPRQIDPLADFDDPVSRTTSRIPVSTIQSEFRDWTEAQSEFKEDVMKKSMSLVSILMVACCVTAFAKEKERQAVSQPPANGFAPAYTKVVKGAERFENANYFTLMAADGIHNVDPKVLYERLQAAVAANERYKALYMARIFTDVRPDDAAAWSRTRRIPRNA
jgi:hypothetical protein